MSVEPLYQDGQPSAKPRTSIVFLRRLITVLSWVTWVLLVIFFGMFVVSVLALAGLEPLQSQLFDDIDPVFTMASLLTMTVSAAAFLVILKQLRLICLTLAQGDPFVPENANRLRTIWIVVAAAEILRLISGFLLSWISTKGSQIGDGETVTMTLDLRIYVWFLVLAIIILAEVFREGTRLRREQKLTI